MLKRRGSFRNQLEREVLEVAGCYIGCVHV